MNQNKLKDEVFLGVVVDNKDPKRIGRCKIKVFQVFDKLDSPDIPWATPWKDINGSEFILPEVGKIVSVVFDQGNKYTPEYIWSQNYNINLENKLKKLNDDSYQSMKGVLLDHSTQIYTNAEEGLKIDHEYSNLNIDPYGNILLNLRDNSSVVTIGSDDAREQFLLGSSFMSWFDTLVSALLGAEGGAYVTDSGAPLLVGPGLGTVLMQYQQLRESFLSLHVKVASNDDIIEQGRDYINQQGDSDYATILPAAPRPESKYYDPNTGRTFIVERPRVKGNIAKQDEWTPSDDGVELKGFTPATEPGGGFPNDTAVAKYWLSRGIRNGYLPTKELVSVGGGHYLQATAALQWKRFLEWAKTQGYNIKANSDWYITSGYRDYEKQGGLKSQSDKRQGGNSAGVAPAGKSAHGWGCALDLWPMTDLAGMRFDYATNKRVRETSPIYKFLDQYARQFGWYNPKRLRDGGSCDESWHFEYWGDV
jgi:hypothetical protein